jgi:sirohydrochlorin cobaltochelatase
MSNSTDAVTSGLLLVAHGSRRESSNEEILALANRLKEKTSDTDWLEAAFLELTDPTVPQMIFQAHQAGVRQLTVFPHFLAAGHHVLSDLPSIIEQADREYPDMEIRLLPHLGASEALADVVLQLAATEPTP